MRSKLSLFPKVLTYRLYRSLGTPNTLPINVTVSVTNLCNSRCKTCSIWKLYGNQPELKDKELKTDEFDRIFSSIGSSVFWATLSGGEPFLRPDLPQIVQALCEHCQPSIVNIPTNSLSPQTIENKTKEILAKSSCPSLVINLSLDGLRDEHDKIRGVPGNFDLFVDTFSRLKRLQDEFSNLHVGIHSVVSKFNIDRVLEVYEYSKKLRSHSYITEVAEQRTELFNKDSDITPNPSEYAWFVKELISRMQLDNDRIGDSVSKATRAFRLTYYQVAADVLRKQQQVISCYAGIASCQISAYGDVWPCCILGYSNSMGSLRESDYDFQKIWFSPKAQSIRKYIKAKQCACPLANAHYTSILCNFSSALRVLGNLIVY